MKERTIRHVKSESTSTLDDFKTATIVSLSQSLAPILVADDDPDDLFFAVRLIKKTGTRNPVIAFDDGVGVVDYLSRAWLTPPSDRSLLPRLLFLDLKMSGLGGFAFLEWVREHPGRAPLKIIVLSGSDEPEDVERAKKLGAKRYLAKYPTVATFKTIIHDVHADQAWVSNANPLPYDPFFESGLPMGQKRAEY